MGKSWLKLAAVAAAVVALVVLGKKYSAEKEVVVRILGDWSERLGIWAIPAYVGLHTVTLCLCLPYAVLFEAAASLVFGFSAGVACVFAAKILAASLSFCAARLVFRRWSGALEWAHSSSHFEMVSRGVERDGWRFVLLARFSPVPSYVINYALAATDVRFFSDFFIPTAVGCLPMVLQNTFIGSLAGAAVNDTKASLSSYILPIIGILSTVLISFRINSYSSTATTRDNTHRQRSD